MPESTKALCQTAAAVLARSFLKDPAVLWALPSEDRREELLRWIFSRNLAAAVRCGGSIELDRRDDPRGAAVWISGDSPYVTLGADLTAGLWASPFKLGLRATSRFLKMSEHWARWRKEAVQGPHFYLCLVGVTPQERGKGLSRPLIESGIAKADRLGQPVALETHLPGNVALYRRFGFELVDDSPVGTDGPKCFTMIRSRR